MKMMRDVAVLAGAALLMAGSVLAIDFGDNITIYDDSSTANTGWYGMNEDQEIEPGCLTGQEWDMEAFFLDESTLTMVGGYDIVNGESGFMTGDIFIDVNGDHGAANNRYGYDYVLDLNMASETYTVYQLGSSTRLRNAYYSMNYESNPWLYRSGGTFVASGTLTYLEGLSDADTGLLGGSHNALSVDLSFLDEGTDFTAHYTMQCGNDNLMGSGTMPVSVPDAGSTLSLLGLALLTIEGLRRKLAA